MVGCVSFQAQISSRLFSTATENPSKVVLETNVMGIKEYHPPEFFLCGLVVYPTSG
jgi:hypothetical protein